MPLRLERAAPDFDAGFAAMLAAKREHAADVTATVTAIIADVRARGDAALIDCSRRFDRLELSPATIRITPDELDRVTATCDPELVAALEFAAERIGAFHARQ
ncbi:MAG TPA: histidinol dehydrogenase, partial [Rhodospirillales bacterium]|nr:histidinol dehydrogenase [Rhodospirillales bacterium]